MVYIILSFFWFFRQTKAILFWLYLWQLKEYHIGRFIDHFRTEKGKGILLNKLLILKIILTFFIYFYSSFSLLFSLLVMVLYSLETAKFFYDFLRKKIKKPVFTKKTIFLLFVAFSFQTFYFLIYFSLRTFLVFRLLIFDILTPLTVSGIVLVFQPLAVLLRNQVIQRARKKREKFKNLLTIGITGSYGKTATKEFLALILSQKFRVLKTREHQNSEIGVSRSILDDLDESQQIFIAEMGAYNRGGIKLLCNIVKPKIGILTGINEQHLATFGSQQNIIRAKYELIESLPEEGTAIFNLNNEVIKNQKSKIKDYNPKLKKIRFCSTREKTDIFAEDIKADKEYLSFKISSKDGDSAFFKVNLMGVQNIENILLAVSCAKELGMNLEEIASACKRIKPSQGGMELLKGIKGINIIDSTYSANPRGVISHLEYLKLWKGRKIIIMPCLIELAQASKRAHKEIGEKIAKTCNLAIITTKECFSEIKKTAIKNGMKKNDILFMEKAKEVIEKVKNFSEPEDIILLEGRISREIKNSLLSQN
ncbi:MAG: UDP-N-acetylmuramoyl-tripeptide--D-alanyl-D-alanine ligase [Candidatus Nealsonbacteria bacterium]|nr:MAG: UDP-N-acetylmuramoyl-tripeptide--D-alanyl-D-alanine ligase [Candidatus Nealsonbacteria bacterium]